MRLELFHAAAATVEKQAQLVVGMKDAGDLINEIADAQRDPGREALRERRQIVLQRLSCRDLSGCICGAKSGRDRDACTGSGTILRVIGATGLTNHRLRRAATLVNRGRRLGRFGIGEEVAASDVLGEDHDIDAAVLGPALSGVVAGDGVIFGVSGGRERSGEKR